MTTELVKGKTKVAKRTVTSGLIDFTAAAHEHTEPAYDRSFTLGTNQQFDSFDVPAYGYLRHILIQVDITGLAGGSGHEDSPWRAFAELTLLDVNGAAIFGPYDGFDTLIANIIGGYAFNPDPRSDPDYNGTAPNYSFALRIPVEIAHNNGLGALANQNTAASLKVRMAINTLANIFSGAPSGTGVMRVRAWLEAWSQPAPTDAWGRPQELTPPRHGTTQYWTKWEKDVSTGDNTIVLPRVGNLIRNLVFVFRNATPVRNTTNFPDPIRLKWEGEELFNNSRYMNRKYLAERQNFNVAGLPAGVFAFPFNHDTMNKLGDDTPELWLPTIQSSRLELVGNFGAAGKVTVLTNDVAPVEVNQDERYSDASETGRPVGQPIVVGV